MRALTLILGMILIGLTQSQANDSIVQSSMRMTERYIYTSITRELYQEKPSLMHHLYQDSWGEISLNGKVGDSQAGIVETGDRQMVWGVEAAGYRHIGRSITLWGTAGHTRKNTKNIQWNEGADFQIVYPIVTGDSIGGGMTEESYFGNAGMVGRIDQWAIGGAVSYRASVSYRQRDPRPKNDVIDIGMTIGVSHPVAKDKEIALTASIGKYHQEQSINYVKTAERASLYHLMGWGMDYTRFAGKNTEAVLSGHTWGGSVTWTSIAGNGWHADLGYYSFRMEKQLATLAYIPIQDLTYRKLHALIAYRATRRRWTWTGALKGKLGTRGVRMNIFDDGTSNYKRIAARPVFDQDEQTVSIESTFTRTSGETAPDLGFMTSAAYQSDSERLLSLSRSIDSGHLSLHGAAWALWRKGSWVMGIRCDMTYRPALHAREELDLSGLSPHRAQAVERDAAIRMASSARWDIAVRIDRRFETWKGGLFLAGRLQSDRKYTIGRNHEGNLTIGMTF